MTAALHYWHIKTVTAAGQTDFHVCGDKKPTARKITALKQSGNSARVVEIVETIRVNGGIVRQELYCPECLKPRLECKCES